MILKKRITVNLIAPFVRFFIPFFSLKNGTLTGYVIGVTDSFVIKNVFINFRKKAVGLLQQLFIIFFHTILLLTVLCLIFQRFFHRHFYHCLVALEHIVNFFFTLFLCNQTYYRNYNKSAYH